MNYKNIGGDEIAKVLDKVQNRLTTILNYAWIIINFALKK